jgi:N-acetylglutamate synthase
VSAADYAALEAAAFASWPALEPEELLHGWRLRYAQGYTRRANSANCGLQAQGLDAARIGEIAARYRQRGLPAVFRLTSLATPPGSDAALAVRGYKLVEPSLVMSLGRLDRLEPAESPRAVDAGTWGAAYEAVSGKGGVARGALQRMLRAIEGERACAVEWEDGEPACCGMGVVSGGRLGLFNIATAPGRRRRGHAEALCRKLLAWGAAAGARSAYLQVGEANAAAVALYRKLGFAPAYTYWYRVEG